MLIRKKDNGRVKIITGIRRCGKSYLLFHLYHEYLVKNGIPEDQIIELALDEADNARYRNPLELNQFVKDKISNDSKHYYVFIDEIQFCIEVDNPYAAGSEQKITFVDTVLGLIKIENADIYVTGSNSHMLSSDVLTQFRDRGDEIHVNPLSFAEFYEAYAKTHSGFEFPISFPMSSPVPDINQAWEQYYTYGGLPYVLELETPEEKSKYLKNLFEETYVKDIVERNHILNENEILETLLNFISSGIGSLTNPLKLENRFRSERKESVSHNTISRYLDYFRDAYIIDCAKRFDIKGSRYFSTPLKYYFTDLGIRNACLNFRQIEQPHIMENIIYNDLVRRGYNVDVGVVQYYAGSEDKKAGTTRVQLEIDFVVNRGSQRYYIQSALSVDDPEKKEQETNSLSRIDDSFRKIVIVRDSIIPRRDQKGILYISIFDFLLKEDAIDL
jgi:predicted AAA+ superfamily ATPase